MCMCVCVVPFALSPTHTAAHNKATSCGERQHHQVASLTVTQQTKVKETVVGINTESDGYPLYIDDMKTTEETYD